MMNTIVPMLPKNIHEIPSGKQLWEAFDRVCLELYTQEATEGVDHEKIQEGQDCISSSKQG